MSIGLYEKKEVQRKLAGFREIDSNDCFFIPDSPLGGLLLVFNCPEVKGLTDGQDFKITPYSSFPSLTEPSRIYLEIEIIGKKKLKVAFNGESLVFNALLESDNIIFLSGKKPDKPERPSELMPFFKRGALSIELACHDGVTTIINSVVFANHLFEVIKPN